MILYHGTNVDIASISLNMCRPYKDFGKGFYLTSLEEQARKMAYRVSRIYGGKPVVNMYEIDSDFFKLLKYLKSCRIRKQDCILKVRRMFTDCFKTNAISEG